MKWKFAAVIVVLSLGVFVLNNPVYAHGEESHKGSMVDGEITAEITESGAINIGNAICPISGELIADVDDGKGVQIEHNGKIYNVCCKFCAKDFKKDPEKFIKVIENNLADGKDPGRDYESDHDDGADHHEGGHEKTNHGEHDH